MIPPSLPWPHPACLPWEELRGLCEERRTKGGGPGGQHRNKVETKVVLRHRESGLEGAAGERRSQEENRREAAWRLRLNLARSVRTRGAAALPRSDLWTGRVKGDRIVCSAEHADFPSLLAEAMDVVAACEEDRTAAAVLLGVTPTQLVRFVAMHPPALESWNRRRRNLGMRPLRG